MNNNKLNFIFYNQFLEENYSQKDIFTHIVDLRLKTKKGNDKYKLFIYDHNSHKKINTFDMIRCLSKKTKSYYFMVIIRAEEIPQYA